MKRWMLLTMMFVVLGMSLACSLTEQLQAERIEITVKNNSPEEACYAYISPSKKEEWGDDQMGDDEKIAVEAERTFRMPEGTYDVSLQNCAEVTIATAWEVSTDTTIVIGAPEATVRFLVDNTSEHEVCFIFITPSVEAEWDIDRMGDLESLPPSKQRMFFIAPGIYDLMAADCDSKTLTEEYDIELYKDLVWTLE